MLPPVLEIHLLWHPDDKAEAQPIAERIAAHFQGGAFASLLSGAVDVQMHATPWQTSSDTPRPILWPDTVTNTDAPTPAQHVAVVPLVALELNRALNDSPAWKTLFAELEQRHGTASVRVLPVCFGSSRMTGHWPKGLRNLQPCGMSDGLDKPHDHKSPAKSDRDTSLPRYLLELVQGLAQWLDEDNPRLKIFISHTKWLSHDDEPVKPLVDMVRGIFSTDSRASVFYDAQSLQSGENWDDALREHAAKSALLAIRTDRYASREWCQREVLAAKRNGMPVVMLDAMTRGEERGSFLLDHVPRLRVERHADGQWSDASIHQALGMLTDGWLHRALWRKQRQLAKSVANPYTGHDWLEHAPEPSTLTRWLPEGTRAIQLLHPDPPLAAPEREVLNELAQRCGVSTFDISTPRLLVARGADLQGSDTPLLPRNALRKRRIGLSASVSEDLARLGLLPSHLSQAVRELARIVFVSGGTLAYGGNLDRDKFSWLLIEELRRYAGDDCGGLELWLSWQEHRRRSVEELTEAKNEIATYGHLIALGEDGTRLKNPCENRSAEAYPPITESGPLASGLTHLRQHLTRGGCARLLIGGKRLRRDPDRNPEGYTGRLPGLLEEMRLSLDQSQPIYLAGGFGGITLILAAQIDRDACSPLLPPDLAIDPEAQHALDEIRDLIGTRGWSALNNGLSVDQNRHLAVTHRPAEIAMLVAQGLGRRPEMPAVPPT